MKTRSSTTNVITAIVATLLSMLLVVCLLATCVVGMSNALTKPEVLSQLVLNSLQELDFEEILYREAEGLNLTTNRYYEVEIVEEIMESDTMEQIVDLQAHDMAAAMTGKLVRPLLTAEMLQSIVHRNANELVGIVCSIDRTADPIAVKANLLAYVDENAEEMVNTLPLEEYTNGSNEVAEAMEILSVALVVLVIVSLVLGGSIYACRYYRFGGFLWVGVDALVAGALMGASALVIPYFLEQELRYEANPEIVEAVLSSFSGLIVLCGLPLLLLGVVLIGLFILLKFTVVRKKLAAANAPAYPAPVASFAPAAPVAPVAPVTPVAPAPAAPVAPVAPAVPVAPAQQPAAPTPVDPE